MLPVKKAFKLYFPTKKHFNQIFKFKIKTLPAYTQSQFSIESFDYLRNQFKLHQLASHAQAHGIKPMSLTVFIKSHRMHIQTKCNI